MLLDSSHLFSATNYNAQSSHDGEILACINKPEHNSSFWQCGCNLQWTYWDSMNIVNHHCHDNTMSWALMADQNWQE